MGRFFQGLYSAAGVVAACLPRKKGKGSGRNAVVRILLAFVLALLSTVQTYTGYNGRPGSPGVAEANAIQGADGNGYYRENASASIIDSLEISANNTTYSPTTTVFVAGATVYVRITSTRVINDNGSNGSVWRVYDHNGSYSGRSGNFTQQPGGPPYVYTASFTMPSNTSTSYTLYVQLRDTSNRYFQTYQNLEVSGSSANIHFYSDPGRTQESYVFSRASSGNHIIYARQYGTNQQASNTNSSFMIYPISSTVGSTFTDPSVITRTGNLHDWQVDLLDSAISGFTTKEGYWYDILPYLRQGGGTTVSRYQGQMIKIDNTGPSTSGISATPNPTNGSVTLALGATVSDDGGQTAYNSTPYDTYISAAEWYTNVSTLAGSGYPMSASGGAFNSSETQNVAATVDISTWAAGTYVFYTRGKDAAGNWGSPVSTTVTMQQPNVRMDVLPATGSANPGAGVSYNVVITNTGLSSDNITMAKADSDSTHFSSSLDASTISGLALNSVITRTLVVTPTQSAAAGASNTSYITVTANSGAGPSRSHTAVTTANQAYNAAVALSPAGGSPAPGSPFSYSVTITNTGNGTDSFTLQKQDSNDANFSSSMNTTTISNLAAGGSVTRTLTVTPTSSIDGGISNTTIVTATAHNGAGPAGSNSAVTTAAQTFGANISVTPLAGTADPGTPAGYTLTITNTGNGTDTIQLPDSDSNPGFVSNLSSGSVVLNRNASTSVTLAITPSVGLLAGDLDVTTVTAKPNNGNLTGGSVLVTTTVAAVYGVTASSDRSTGSNIAGAGIVYTVTVVNSGTTTDTLSLGKSDSDPVQFSSGLGAASFSNVPPGGSVATTLVVTPSVGTAAGATDTTSVTATSAGNPAKSSTVEVTSSVVAGLVSVGTADASLAKINQGQLNIPMMSVIITATAGDGPVSGIKVGRTGTAPDADVALVKIIQDNNGDGRYDPISETTLASGAFVNGVADLTFTSAVATNPPLRLAIVYDMTATAGVGKTIGTILTNTTFIKTESGVSGPFPASSGLATIYDAGYDFTPPAPPTALNGRATGWNMISVNWAVPVDNVGVVSYTVEISSASLGSFGRPVYPGNKTFWVDTLLAKDTTYQYRVKAFDAAGNASGFSPAITLKTSATTTNPHASSLAMMAACNVCHNLYNGTAGTSGYQKSRVDLLCYTCHNGSAAGAGSYYDVRAEFGPSSDGDALTPGSSLKSYHKVYSPTVSTDKYNDVYCSRCHGHGYVTRSAMGSNYIGPRMLKNPYTLATSTVQFCYGCHTSAGDPNAYAFGGNISSTFTASAHKTNLAQDPTGSGNNIVCMNCHGPHASNNDFLVGRTTYTAGGNGTKPIDFNVSYSSTSYGGSRLCLSSGCHDASSTSPSGWNVYNQFYVSSTQHSVVTSTGGSAIGCSSCHGPHTVQTTAGSIVSDPANTMNLAGYTSAAEKTSFCITCHDGTPPTYAVSGSTIVPQTITFPSNQTITSNSGGWNKADYTTGVGHFDRGYSCDRCHDPHASDNPRLVTAPEDTLASGTNGVCLQCHDGSAPAGAKNIKVALVSATHHPTLETSTVHSDTENLNSLPLNQRHAECVDCHDPHQARAGLHTPTVGNLSNALLGVSGVDVTNSTNWVTPTYSAITSITEEYQLCFKCHSSYSWDGNAPNFVTGTFKATDLGREFNVNNSGYHWVENDKAASSGNTPRTNYTTRTMSFTYATWTKSSPMTCTDCHGSNIVSDAEGPHGSALPFVLKAPWRDGSPGNTPGTGKTGSQNDLCFQCHPWNNYGQGGNGSQSTTGFSDGANRHTYHMGRSEVTSCMTCHSVIPHGYGRGVGDQGKAMLVNWNESAPYTSGNATYGSKVYIANWAQSGNWNKNDCGIRPDTSGGHG